MRLAYAQPETELSAESCFTKEDQEFLEHQIVALEGKTNQQKNHARQTIWNGMCEP